MPAQNGKMSRAMAETISGIEDLNPSYDPD
jgi:hypothetical protein